LPTKELAIQAILSGDMDIGFERLMPRCSGPRLSPDHLPTIELVFPVTTMEFTKLADLGSLSCCIRVAAARTDCQRDRAARGIKFGDRSYVPASNNRVWP
jgi:hypothetical protein